MTEWADQRSEGAEAKLSAIRALHMKGKAPGVCGNPDCSCAGFDCCLHCTHFDYRAGGPWPYPTIRAMDGLPASVDWECPDDPARELG